MVGADVLDHGSIRMGLAGFKWQHLGVKQGVDPWGVTLPGVGYLLTFRLTLKLLMMPVMNTGSTSAMPTKHRDLMYIWIGARATRYLWDLKKGARVPLYLRDVGIKCYKGIQRFSKGISYTLLCFWIYNGQG